MEYTTNYQSEFDILRMAERERAEVVADFFRKLFTKREKEVLFPGNVLPID